MKTSRQGVNNLKKLSVLLGCLCSSVSVGQVIVDQSDFSSTIVDETSLFARKVVLSGDKALVSTLITSGQAANSARVELYDIATGQLIFDLTPLDIESSFNHGSSIDIDGNTAVIGAGNAMVDGVRIGAAYIIDVDTGLVRYRVISNDGAFGDGFGFSVAVSGDFAIIGATQDDDGARGAGSAYIFNVNTGEQIMKLTADDALMHDNLGQRVALSENRALVTAGYADIDGEENSGAVYVFDITSGDQLHKLISDDSSAGGFGWQIDIDDGIAIVSNHSNRAEGAIGAAFIFDTDSGDLLYKLTENTAQVEDAFGSAVVIDGHYAIVGAPNTRGNDGSNAAQRGAAFLYDLRSGVRIASMEPRNTNDFAHFGSTIDISGESVVIASPGMHIDKFRAGSVHVFDLPCAADFVIDGSFDFFDVGAFIFLFSEGNLRADFNNDGALNFFDVSAFLQLFAAGCP